MPNRGLFGQRTKKFHKNRIRARFAFLRRAFPRLPADEAQMLAIKLERWWDPKRGTPL